MTKKPQPGDRLEFTATAVECVDASSCPYIILVRFTDADGRQHDMTAKDAYFGNDITDDTAYPVPVTVPCEVLEVADGIASVKLSWQETDEDLWQVRVPTAALVEPRL